MSQSFSLTDKQNEAVDVLISPAKHVMLYGGSRSGKTFLGVYAIVLRALKAPNSRHLILRLRSAHVRQAIWMDTLPKVMAICFPGVAHKTNQQLLVCKFPNGSEIWLGGLDDKERAEKILGNEYATIYANECSQIPFSSITKARTRLAQKIKGLVNKFYYDCNPPTTSHWTYREFIEKQNPRDLTPLKSPDNYDSIVMNPHDNAHNLSDGYLEELEALPKAERERFLYGLFTDQVDGAYFSTEMAEADKEGRIGHVPYDNRFPVHTWWDIGMRDATAIWFVQYHGNRANYIDYYEESGRSLQDIAAMISNRGYDVYAKHHLPHDGKKRDMGNGKSIEDQARTLLPGSVETHSIHKVHDTIFAARTLLPKCLFDREKCIDGIDALRNYRTEYNEKLGVYKDNPLHDAASHGADAFRYSAMDYSAVLAGTAAKTAKRKSRNMTRVTMG